MPEPVPCLERGDGLPRLLDWRIEGLAGACLGSSQGRFDLAQTPLHRRQVRRVRRHIAPPSPAAGQRQLDAGCIPTLQAPTIAPGGPLVVGGTGLLDRRPPPRLELGAALLQRGIGLLVDQRAPHRQGSRIAARLAAAGMGRRRTLPGRAPPQRCQERVADAEQGGQGPLRAELVVVGTKDVLSEVERRADGSVKPGVPLRLCSPRWG